MKEKYVAIIVQKIKLNKNIYFLKFDSTIKDACITGDKMLIDTNNDRYWSFDDLRFYLTKHNDLAYMYPLTHDYVMEAYCKESLKIAIKKYIDYFNANTYFAVLDDKQNVRIVQIKKSSIINSHKNAIDTSIIEAINTSSEVRLTMSEKVLDDITNKLEHQDLEYANIILKGLKQICNNVREKGSSDNKSVSNNTIKDSDTREKSIQTTNKVEPYHNLNVLKVYRAMKEEVVGQDEIIMKLLEAIDKNNYANLYADNSEDRVQVLIVGPTGSGKTRIMRSLQKHLNWPLVRIDTTQITMNGYHGGTIEDNILIPLLAQANGNIELAQKGIVNLDEIDKKGSKDNQDVAGRGVLNSFLPFLDGTIYNVKYKSEYFRFDTSNLTVFASGAFEDILEQNNKVLPGFNSQMIQSKKISNEILETEGNIPKEFLGRFSVLAQMRQLEDKDLKQILMQPKASPLTFNHNYLLDCYNVLLNYNSDYIDAIVKKALELKTGARSLKTIIEDSLSLAKWQIMKSENLKEFRELIVSGETVENPKKYILK